MPKSRVKKGDLVVVIAGKDRDRSHQRRVLEVYPKRDRVLVEGAGIIKRHTRPNPQKNIKGGIVERESPIHVSNVMLVDPESKKPSRVGIKVTGDRKTKIRVARRSGAAIDK
jgi:large subunit ribosomal protein L24